MYHHLAHMTTEAAFEARGWSTSGERGTGYSTFFHCMLSSDPMPAGTEAGWRCPSARPRASG
eukprot:268673-Rhodomonas_salina.1